MKCLRLSAISASALAAALLTAPTAQAAHQADIFPPCSQTLVSAHEGYTADADGDTVESQVAALDLGVNIADTDVWVTKDGYIVEMHDNDVSHSTDGHGLITEMTLDQVLALRTKQHHEAVPQLNDSLAIPEAHDPGRYLMIEMKYVFSDPDYRALLDSEIAAAGMTDNVIIYTQYLGQAQALNALDPELTVWYKIVGTVPPVGDVQGVDGVMIPSGQINAGVVQAFHDAGMTATRERVQTESKVSWQRFLNTGADSLMTAEPVKMMEFCDGIVPVEHI